MAKSILSGLHRASCAGVSVVATLLQSAQPIADAVEYTAEAISEDIPVVVDRTVEQARVHGANLYRAVDELGAKQEAKQKARFERRYGSATPTHAQMVEKLIAKEKEKHAKKERKQQEITEMMALRQQVAELQKLIEELKKPAS